MAGEFYREVPKDFEANLEYRRKLLTWGSERPENADDLWEMCSRDLLFYVNAFCYTYDPIRYPPPLMIGRRPFITWDYQDDTLLDLDSAIGREDRAALKARDMGFSWMVLILYEWHWHFHDDAAFLCLSRNEDYVDKRGDPKCLFWKIDFIHKHQPLWLLPDFLRRKLQFENLTTRSTISGESTTGRAGRGGKFTSILYDEFAHFARDDAYEARKAGKGATNAHFYVSTPVGTNNAFHDVCTHAAIPRITLDWHQHPLKARGLYTSEAGELEILDPDYDFPADYDFRLDGMIRSPWFDHEEDTAIHPMELRQEVLHDFLGSVAQFFTPVVMEKVQRSVREPWDYTNLDFVEELCEAPHDYPVEWEGGRGALMKLWLNLDGGRPPPGDYVVGADVAQGTGASNSVLVVCDAATGEKVAELASPWISAEEFGRVGVAVARWFWDALLIWEATGPGRGFGSKVIRLGYHNVYLKRNETKRDPLPSDVPGWFSTTAGNQQIFGDLKEAIKTGAFVERSEDALADYEQYIFTPARKIEHSAAGNVLDPSGAGANHGDRIVANAVCYHAMHDVVIEPAPDPTDPPRGSFAWRRKLWEDSLKREEFY